MNFLKNLAVSLCSFLLFLALTVFGLAYDLKATVLSPDFVTTELNNLQIAPLVEEYVQSQNPANTTVLNDAINKTVAGIEPDFKKQAGVAIHSVYDYLLGSKPDPELAATLRLTFFSSDFVTPLVNNLNLATLLSDPISQQIASAVPIQIPNLDSYVSQSLSAVEPSLKQQIISASGPVADYILGISPSFKITISLQQALADLKTVLRQEFINSPTTGLQIPGISLSSIPQNQLGIIFDTFYPTIAGTIPSTYTIDQSMLSPDLPAQFGQGITGAEDGLGKARLYVNYFQQGYTWAIVFMALMVLIIVVIVRNVKDVTHRLGIPLVTYGVLEYGGVLVTKYLISSGKFSYDRLIPGLPASLENWLTQLTIDSMRPVEVFSIAILVLGAALVVISFVYKPHKELTWS